MFAGGMAIGVPSFMPEAASDLSVTEGLLTVSTTTLQGAAVLEIVVNDPDNSDTLNDVNALSVDVGSITVDMTQATNGKWYVYVVDDSVATLMDADTTGLEFGFQCTAGIGVGAATTGTGVLVADSSDFEVWANAINTVAQTAVSGGCFDLDNTHGTSDDTTGSTSRDLMTAAVLQGAPSLSDPDGDSANLGQRGHALNASGHGSWPYIISEDLSDDNVVSYGGDSINVVYGNTDDETSIELANRNPADRVEVHLTITDPALNIDPTTADKWVFDLDQGTSATTVAFGTTELTTK